MNPIYQNQVQRVYMRLFSEVEWDSPLTYIYAQAGKAYAEIRELNHQYGYGPSGDGFDNQLVFCLTGWIKNNVINQFIQPKPIPEIADEIATQILAYYRTRGVSR